jgi:hypothetical protein
VVQVDVLPDDILLDIFRFYVIMHFPGWGKPDIEAWQSLVHVCRRWRDLVLGSPRRLNLRLCCTPKTPARDMLDIWPALPLVFWSDMQLSSRTDNVIAALGQSNRVRFVFLWGLASRQVKEVLATMHVPFPELTDLRLISNGETMPVVPDSFLGGSAPRLQHFSLSGIPFPGSPRLLLSATHLESLWLTKIPHSGYIPPEAIVALISVSSSLTWLILEFGSPQSRPDRETRRFPPSNRSVIPALSTFSFKGAIEYLEDFVTRIDTPQLGVMCITFLNQIDFDTPRLAQFINRTPKLMKTDAHVRFDDNFARVLLQVPPTYCLEIKVSCREADWQLSSIEQLCNSSFPSLSTVEQLSIGHEYSKLVWKNDTIENTLWLQLLLPFTGVKNLHLSKDFAPGIASALQELVGGRITEVLPSLQNIFVEWFEPSGPFQENIGKFVAARQLLDQLISVSAVPVDLAFDSTPDAKVEPSTSQTSGTPPPDTVPLLLPAHVSVLDPGEGLLLDKGFTLSPSLSVT